MSRIREVDYSEAEFAICAALYNASYPDLPYSAEDFLSEYRIRDMSLAREFYLYGEAGFIELGHAYWYKVPGKMYAKFESYDQRHDEELLEFALTRLATLGGTKVLMFSRTSKPSRTELLKRVGCEHVQTEPISRLLPEQFNFEYAAPREALAHQNNVEILTLADYIIRCENFARNIYEHAKACLRDVPSPDTVEPPPFEIWVERLNHKAWYDHETFVIALHNDEIVGTSGMHPCSADPTILFTGLTGVRSDFRRRGVATAMKAEAARIAIRRKIRAVMTDNDESNPMFELNKRLGFECYDAWLHYMREL
ncbi:MAG: GNAT family N-acetyltransferase [Fimbriimonadales bacterium]